MLTIQEPARHIPVVDEVDVAVVGGSCTGVFAAVRAARLGMRVAIVEKQNCFGGVATAGNVHIWHALHDTVGKREIIGGLTREMIERLEKRDAVLPGPGISSAYRLNTEELKIDLDEIVVEHKITPYLHTFYVAPVAKDDTLQAIIIENKNGRQAIRARQFIDATGDGDVARSLGLPTSDPGTLQPPTTCAKIYGMNTLGDFDWTAAIREHGEEFGLGPDWGWGSAIPAMPDLQMRADTHVYGLDTADANDLTQAEMDGRRRVRAIMDVIRKYGPPEASIALADLAATIGIRETRRVDTAYRLTGNDVLTGRRFDDAIANGSYPVDTHHDDGTGITFRYLDGTQRTVPGRGQKAIMSRWRDPIAEDPTFYQVPFRCLVPGRITNLTLAGRMLDADKTAFSAVRVMVNTNQTGEAAGVAAALAIKDSATITALNPQAIRQTLANGGSIII